MDPALTTTCHVVEIDGTGLDVEWGYADGTVFPEHYDDVSFVNGADLQGFLRRMGATTEEGQHEVAFSGPEPWFEVNDKPAVPEVKPTKSKATKVEPETSPEPVADTSLDLPVAPAADAPVEGTADVSPQTT